MLWVRLPVANAVLTNSHISTNMISPMVRPGERLPVLRLKKQEEQAGRRRELSCAGGMAAICD
jgi:hypothetical protein